MNNFFDLKEFLVLCVKKAKFIILVMIIIAVAWGGYNSIPLLIERINFKESAVEEVEMVDEESPYLFSANRTILISPSETEINGILVSRADYIADAFLSYSKSKDSIGVLTTNNFDEYVEHKVVLKQKMVTFNYRTKLFLQEKVTLADFSGDVSVQKLSSNIIYITVTTGDSEFSEKLVDEYTALLNKLVKKNAGSFEFSTIAGQATISLPQSVDGLIPIKVLNPGSSESISGVRPSLKTIAKSGIRGGVYGALLGFGLALLIVLLKNILSNKVTSDSFFTEKEISILAAPYIKKVKKTSFLQKLANRMEGYSDELISAENAAELVLAKIAAQNPDVKSVLVTGTSALVKSFGDELAEAAPEMEIVYSKNISYSSEALKLLNSAELVLIVEQLDSSSENEVLNEIRDITMLNKNIFGVVLYK